MLDPYVLKCCVFSFLMYFTQNPVNILKYFTQTVNTIYFKHYPKKELQVRIH